MVSKGTGAGSQRGRKKRVCEDFGINLKSAIEITKRNSDDGNSGK